MQVPESTSDTTKDNILNAFYGLALDGVAMIPDQAAYQRHDPAYAQTVNFAEAIHYMDAQIRMAILHQHSAGSVLAQERSIATAQIAAQPQTDHTVENIASALAEGFTRQVLHPLIEANFGAAALLDAPMFGYPKEAPVNNQPGALPRLGE